MITTALPGIKEFLEEVLVDESLSDKGEQLRHDFVDKLDKLGSKALDSNIIFTTLEKDQRSPHHSPETHKEKSAKDDIKDNTEVNLWCIETVLIRDRFNCFPFFLTLFFLHIGKTDIACGSIQLFLEIETLY